MTRLQKSQFVVRKGQSMKTGGRGDKNLYAKRSQECLKKRDDQNVENRTILNAYCRRRKGIPRNVTAKSTRPFLLRKRHVCSSETRRGEENPPPKKRHCRETKKIGHKVWTKLRRPLWCAEKTMTVWKIEGCSALREIIGTSTAWQSEKHSRRNKRNPIKDTPAHDNIAWGRAWEKVHDEHNMHKD